MLSPACYALRMLVVVILLFIPKPALFGQACINHNNIDFETGTLTQWEFDTGACCPIVGSLSTLGPVPGRHALTTGATLDPYGNFPAVAPGGGNFSFKLGNNSGGRQAERARYFVRVPFTPGRYILVYRYAVVLQDPNHDEANQPRFEVNTYDSVTKQPLSCNKFSYVASSIMPGFIRKSDVVYKPWTTGTIDLTGMGGKTIAVEFASGDCGFGGHFGYGYVDMNCSLFEVYAVKCNGSPNITLTAPTGYAKYTWMDAGLTKVIDTHRVATLPAPPTATTYAIVLTPYQGFGCNDTLYTTYVVANTTADAGRDTVTCINGQVPLNATGSTTDGPLTFEWFPITGLSCFNCTNPTLTATKTGYYYVKATSKSGCSFTDSVRIKVDTIILADIVANRDTVCPKDIVTGLSRFKKNPAAATYTWTTDNANYTFKSRDTIIMDWNSAGVKNIKLQISYQGCSVTDSTRVYVRVKNPMIVTPNFTACIGDSIQLNARLTYPIPVPMYHWSPIAFLTCVTCTNPKTFTKASKKYYVTVLNEGICTDVAEVNITIDTTIAKLPPIDTICQYDSILIQNRNLDSSFSVYTWTVNTGNILRNDKKGTIMAGFPAYGKQQVTLNVKSWKCNTRDTAQIEVLRAPLASLLFTDTLCATVPISFTPVKENAAYYWNVQEQPVKDTTYKTHQFLWPTEGSKHISLRVKDVNGCVSLPYDTTIDLHKLPEAYLWKLFEDKPCAGDRLEFETTHKDNYTYTWKPAEYFEKTNGSKATMLVQNSGNISVVVTNEWGCTSESGLYIDADGCCEVFMPNAFTPNNDGHNDTYRPLGIDKQVVQTFMITNRWGQVIFTGNSPVQGWDGTFKGKPVEPGTYFYMLKYQCQDKELEQKGDLILLR